MAWTNENPNEETIKCVVVGDNNAGKTRLICSRAYKQPNFSFKKYGGSHVPTVWAIDQYRNNQEVLDNARGDIDDVTFSLRLWDTFGDHHKDRRFAYGRADVVLVCFSVCDRKSMHNIKKFWLRELRQHCKKIPVFIVACKTDLRFVDLAELNRNKSRLTREIKPTDLIFPEESRSFAKDLECQYYETSVLMDYGINDVFDNAIRAALMYRRGLSFWKPVLKRVKRPTLQEPLLPSKPKEPPLFNVTPDPCVDVSNLLCNELCADVTLFCQETVFPAHKVVLASASTFFLEQFTEQRCSFLSQNQQSPKKSNNIFIVALESLKPSMKQSNVGTELMNIPHLRSVSSTDSIDDTMFENIYDAEKETIKIPHHISPPTFSKIIELCYKGTVLLPNNEDSEKDFLNACTYFKISVRQMDKNVITEEGRIFSLYDKAQTIKDSFLTKNDLTDVVFEVDDGLVQAHKAFLVSGCEVMSAMFSGKFAESFSDMVPLPGTCASSLKVVLEYIYTGASSFSQPDIDFIDLIKLTNRLWLPSFMKQIEYFIIDGLRTSFATLEGEATVEMCSSLIDFLEVGQLHNADVLVKWCMHFICIYYNDVCRQCPKQIKLLSLENMSYLSDHRWPPVWYIKDKDNYDKAVRRRAQSGDEYYLCKNKHVSRSRSRN